MTKPAPRTNPPAKFDSREKLEDFIKGCLADNLADPPKDCKKISLQINFIKEFQLDDLDFLEFVMCIEEDLAQLGYEVEIDELEVSHLWHSLQDVVEWVKPMVEFK